MSVPVPASVVIASKIGRLGNRLFLSAYFMANALARGYKLFNPALGEYAHLFKGSAYDPICAFPSLSGAMEAEFSSQCREQIFCLAGGLGALASTLNFQSMQLLDIRNSYDYEDRTYDLSGADYTEVINSCRFLFVKGWKFRDEKNLLKYHAEISRYFTPIDAVSQPAEKSVSMARKQGDQVIGVHIRQGDYRGWKNGIHYFETAQYAHWMRHAASLFPEGKTVFLVCASDPLERSHLQGLNFVEGPGSMASDLHALSLCDKIIAPPSTFSSWASYHGRVPLCMMESHSQQVARESFVLHDGV